VHTIAARTRADNELSLKSTVGGGDRTLTIRPDQRSVQWHLRSCH